MGEAYRFLRPSEQTKAVVDEIINREDSMYVNVIFGCIYLRHFITEETKSSAMSGFLQTYLDFLAQAALRHLDEEGVERFKTDYQRILSCLEADSLVNRLSGTKYT